MTERGLTPQSRGAERDEEVSFTAHTATVTNTRILLGVQGVEERAQHEVGGPDHGRRRDEEAASNTADRETDELGGHDDHPLVAKVVGLVVVNALYRDDIRGVGRTGTDACHDSNEYLQSNQN